MSVPQGNRTEATTILLSGAGKLTFTNPQVDSTVGLPRTPRGDGSVSEPLVQFGYERRAEALSRLDLFGIKPCCDNWDSFMLMSMGQYILNTPRISRFIGRRDRICIEGKVIQTADTGAPKEMAKKPVQQKFPPSPGGSGAGGGSGSGEEPSGCSIDNVIVTPNLCIGFYNVQIEASGTGAINYNWTVGFGSGPNGFISSASWWNASVTITDSTGCQATVNIARPPLNFEITASGQVFAGDPCEITLKLTEISGGYPPYTYKWQQLIDGEYVDIDGETGLEYVSACAGEDYRGIVIDAEGCERIVEFTGV